MRVPTSASHCCGHQSVEAGPGSVCRRGCGRRCPAVLCTRPHPRPPPNLPHPSTHTFNRTWRAAKSSNEKMLPARAGDAIVCVPCTGRPGRRQAVQPLRLRRSRGWARMRWRGWWCGVPGERHPLWPCAAARRTLPPAARAAGARARLGAGRPAQGPVGWSLRGSQPSRTGSLGAVAQPACGACAGDGRPTLPGAPMDAPRRWSRRTWTGAFADAEIERAYWDDQHVECAFFSAGSSRGGGARGGLRPPTLPHPGLPHPPPTPPPATPQVEERTKLACVPEGKHAALTEREAQVRRAGGCLRGWGEGAVRRRQSEPRPARRPNPPRPPPPPPLPAQAGPPGQAAAGGAGSADGAIVGLCPAGRLVAPAATHHHPDDLHGHGRPVPDDEGGVVAAAADRGPECGACTGRHGGPGAEQKVG